MLPARFVLRTHAQVATAASKVGYILSVVKNFLFDIGTAIREAEEAQVNRWTVMCRADFFGICSPAIPPEVTSALKRLKSDMSSCQGSMRSIETCLQSPSGCEKSW